MLTHFYSNLQGTYNKNTDWEHSGHPPERDFGAVLPETDIPLSDQQMEMLRAATTPLQHSDCSDVDMYLETVEYAQSLVHDMDDVTL